jgi:hypothetical protein
MSMKLELILFLWAFLEGDYREIWQPIGNTSAQDALLFGINPTSPFK